ncbi:Abi family protein [Actinobacillus minor]|uniref:Abi family protein n=1 Tax=Actinobacillus minor TaxID=51047 RepID=UPI0023F00ED4|nr:Abi family protein [Actinobacillus minor]MDD6911649.1 Abi family protein [Actinobacillus minor]MDY4713998.1 Abi family protein [Actinobacillus minor]
MKQQKIWKSFNDQLKILKGRGLLVDDEKKALGYLKSIGYYRLSGYLYSFRQIDSHNTKKRLDQFIPNSRFEDVKKLYMFDKKLRQLALDALERIEIALRVNIAYTLGQYDPLAYQKSQYVDPCFNHQSWLNKYQSLIDRESESSFVKHHLEHYGDLPIWAACEVWDFGTMSMLYKGMLEKDKDHIAKIYHLKDGKHLQTHLHAFNFIRNVSAHHSRLWNKPIIFKANLKGLKDAQWRQFDVAKPFVYFCLMKRMLDVICPNSTWGERFLALLNEFPQTENQAVTLQQMGMISDLTHWDLWKKS